MKKYRVYCKQSIQEFDSGHWYNVHISVIKDSKRIMVYGLQEQTNSHRTATIEVGDLFSCFRVMEYDEDDLKTWIQYKQEDWDDNPLDWQN